MSQNTTENPEVEVDSQETAAAETSGQNTAAHEPSQASLGHGGDRNYRKVRQGYVVSDKMDKTITVMVEDRVKHALYGKVLRRSEKVKVHDEANTAGVGDRVLIMETRPLSATKRWRLVEILEKAK
ncbi:30S ribosomal protein S17 [Ornithinimicrobium pratense]|uniref:Small ribosomal subunit protein uS17 n=1 Tax=Ornithinimicrobium pratense TaxID=2593973 RepID=A0A5J6V8B7_9MICO|nr:30S ribosomal protein S17 [Ornithinimicrobium pratense]QFG69313.1 30S ribosomal protein S17 [Ornithinimicrobium pratense]